MFGLILFLQWHAHADIVLPNFASVATDVLTTDLVVLGISADAANNFVGGFLVVYFGLGFGLG